MVLRTKFPTKWIAVPIILFWSTSIYWMYTSTQCSQQIEQLAQLDQMENVIKNQNNQLQSKINIIQKENVHLQAIINNMTALQTDQIPDDKPSESSDEQQSPASHAITLQQLLRMLKTIKLEHQIDRINNVYKTKMGWNYSLNITNILSNKKSKNEKTLILTAFVDPSKNSSRKKLKYNIDNMRYAYDTKLVYADLHKNETVLIIDTFDYISHLNLATKFGIKTPTNDIYDEWNNMLSPYFTEHMNKYRADFEHNRNYDREHRRFDCTTLLNKFWWKHKIYVDKRNTKYFFAYSYRITSHFNKIISILFWSQYFDYILWMDDDAFFGNLNISIHYYFDLIPKGLNNDIFLILPMDHNVAMVFSNFAFYINTTETADGRSKHFLYEWFNSRRLGFQFYDQDAMNYAILQYLITYDYKFKSYLNDYYIYANPFKYLLFHKCIEYCKVCPVDHMCLDNCLRAIHFRRCTEKELLKKTQSCLMVMNTTIFWSPFIDTKLSTIDDDYDIYPFIFQNGYSTHYRFLFNRSYRDPQLKYLKKMYDNTFIIHKRFYLKKPDRLERDDIPFLYAYTKSNSRSFVVNYLRKHNLLLKESEYPSVELQTKYTLHKLLTEYQHVTKRFNSYGKGWIGSKY